jgi:hypothetical protein
MTGNDDPIGRIAELQRISRAQAEAYVKSTARQLGPTTDLAPVAMAIVSILAAGGSCKAKDVARVMKNGAPPVTPRKLVPAEPPPEVPDEPVAKGASGERRRDTRLRFEQWAKNPKCEANTLSAVHGISLAHVAKAEGLSPSMGQSPFALARGETFEASLFRANAARLIEELAKQEVIPKPDADFKDLRLKRHRGPFRTLDEAREATSMLLKDVAGKGKGKPIVAAGATLRIPGGVMLPEAILVVDVLVIRRDVSPPALLVGEVKTYPDRAGYTDAKELAVARAQAGVYVHGLRLVLEELGLAGKMEVPSQGFLVLSRPGYNAPSVRAGEDLEFQVVRARRGFERLQKAADLLPKGGGDPLPAILAAPTAYGEACISFCDRAPLCWKKAVDAGDPVILGEDVARWLGRTPLDRALALMDGAKPANKAEEDLVQRMKSAELPEISK